MEHWDPSVMFRIVDIAAVAANGLLGGAVARAFRFDIVGFVMLAIVSGMGGGMIRDVLLNSGFPVALTDAGYWVGVLAAAAVAYTIDLGSRWADRLLIVLDFVGMGAWTATGTLKALGLGLHWLPAVALGVTTAVGGGAIRDIMVNRIPAVFGGNSLYATIAVIGGAEMVVFQELLHRPNLGMGAAIVTCGVLGILSRWRNWRLPAAVDLTVPRPKLRLGRRRIRRGPLKEQGWTPGEPLTRNLETVTPEQIRRHRRRRRRRVRDRA